jgi:hypothetical protein
MSVKPSASSLFNSLENSFTNQLPNAPDSFVIVTGSASSGKSILISSLQSTIGSSNLSIPPSSTIALDYTPLRNPLYTLNQSLPLGGEPTITSGVLSSSSSSSSSSLLIPASQREVAHIWELGGGSLSLADLIQVPITAQRLPSNVAVLVLDLSKPGDVCNTATKWIGVLKKRADECLDRIKKSREKSNSSEAISDTILKNNIQMRLRVGYAQRGGQRINISSSEPLELIASKLPDHPDWDFILSSGTLLPFQTIIIGSKWDEFRDLDAPKRRIVLAAVRLIGLCTGAHVICVNHKDKSTLSTFRGFFLHACFGSEVSTGIGADDAAAYPLSIPAGADSLSSILSCINTGPSSSPTKALGLTTIGKTNNVSTLSLTRTEIENASASVQKGDFTAFSLRLEKISVLIKLFFQPTPISAAELEDLRVATSSSTATATPDVTSGSTNSEIVFSDEAAVVYPEPRIDELRAKKAQALALLIAESKEKERRAAVEARAVLKGQASTTKSTTSEGKQ